MRDSADSQVRAVHVRLQSPAVLAVLIVASLLCLASAALPPGATALTEFDVSNYGVGANARGVDTGDLNADGITDVVTANAGDGSISVLLGAGGGVLGVASSFATTGQPTDVVLADVNKDGKLDVVTADSGGNVVSVLLGNGDGSFAAHADFATGAAPRGVAVFDVNNDGRPDILTANLTDDSVSVLLGDGQGGFAAHQDYAAGAGPIAVAAADLDLDGSVDLVTVDNSDATFTVLPGRGDGSGSFGTGAHFPAGTQDFTSTDPVAVCISDIDRDGRPDVVVATSNYGYVTVSRGDGHGSFTAQPSWYSGSYGSDLALADFNSDGVTDFVTAATSANVRLGSADGRFYALWPTLVEPWATGGAVGVAVADMDKDGRADIVTANGAHNEVSVALNSGPHAFWATSQCDITAGSPVNAMALTVGDLNEDGKPDVVAGAGSSIQVALGSGNGMFTSGGISVPAPQVDSYASGFDAYSYGVVTGKFDGDTHLDVVAAFAEAMVFFPGDGQGHLGAPVHFGGATSGGSRRIVAGDIDKDGRLDIVATPGETTTAGVDVYRGNGNGTFAPASPVAMRAGAGGSVVASALALADLDKDGDLDIAVGGGGSVDVALGNGNGTFAATATYSAGTFTGSPVYFPEYVLVGDFTGDGKRDLALTSVGGMVTLLVGKGDGTFAGLIPLVGDKMTVGAPVTGDFSGDGKLDLMLAPNSAGDATVLLNDGAGTFLQYPSKVLGEGRNALAIAGADFNGDGKQDFVLTEGTDMHVVLGSGLVPLAATFTVNAGAAKASSAALSMDSDATGVTHVRFSADGTTWTDWQPYQDHLAFTAPAPDGTKTIRAQYRGSGGEVLRFSDDITLDTTPPRITYGWAPDWCKDYTEVWISSSDPGSGVTTGLAKIEYRMNGEPWQVVSKKSYVDLMLYGYGVDQVVAFDFRLTDALGNQTAIQTLTLKIDGAAPVTTQTGADDLWHGEDVTVTFAATDGGIGVDKTQYSVDAGATWTYGVSLTVYAHPDVQAGQLGGDGVHAIKYRSIDKFGHVEAAQSCDVKIDTDDVTPPTVGQSGADAAWHNKPVTVVFSGSDEDTGVALYEYSTDAGVTWYPSPSVTVSTPGTTTVLYRATDGAGNVSLVGSCMVRIDTNAPRPAAPTAASVRRGNTAYLKYIVRDVVRQSPDTVTIKIRNSRGVVVRTARIAGVRLNSMLTYKFRCTLPRGTYAFLIYARDGAGNTQVKVARNKLVVR